MQILSSLLFGVSASLDALLLGISYGIRKIHIGLWQNLFISLITLSGTCLSIGIGRWQSTLLGDLLPTLSRKFPLERCLGSTTLMLFGMYYLLKFMLSLCRKCLKKPVSKEIIAQSQENASATENVQKNHFALKDSVLLGLALTANNMGIGLSASIAGLSMLPAAITTLLFSAVFLGLGNCLGNSRLSELLGQAATPVSGLLLLGLGFCEWFL